jgi:hypothetical protein
MTTAECAVRYYIDILTSDPEALHSSFGFYRAADTSTAQNEAPDELLAALTAFLDPYRDGQTAVPSPRQEVPDTSRQRTGTPH